MIDPNKEYHLEFNTPSELHLLRTCKSCWGASASAAVSCCRKNMYVLYLKDSEHIEDTLTYMGAQQCTIALMNIKIRKDMRNKANRVRNCDEANINKVVGCRHTADTGHSVDHPVRAAGGTFSGTTGTGRTAAGKSGT